MLAPNPALPISLYQRLFYEHWGIRLLLFFLCLHSPHRGCQQSWTLPQSIFFCTVYNKITSSVMDYLPRGSLWIIKVSSPLFAKLYEKGSMSANTISALSFLCTGCFFFSFSIKNSLFVLIVLRESAKRN